MNLRNGGQKRVVSIGELPLISSTFILLTLIFPYEPPMPNDIALYIMIVLFKIQSS